MSGTTTSLVEMRKSIRAYLMVFGALLGLTCLTVGLSYLHLNRALAITLGLLVASIKASLVALYFMHLNHEKALIYFTVFITLVLFVFVMSISFY